MKYENKWKRACRLGELSIGDVVWVSNCKYEGPAKVEQIDRRKSYFVHLRFPFDIFVESYVGKWDRDNRWSDGYEIKYKVK
jgi:hypothetical protein